MSRFPSASSARPALIIVSLLAVAVVAGGIFWHFHARAEQSGVASGQASADGKTDGGSAADTSGAGILLGLASTAIREQHLVAPAGSNAYEFYLSVLQLDPANQAARSALKENLPRACEEIERTINQNELDEARREIDLLRDFDSNNFTLALLGGKLSAARNIVVKQHEAEAELIQAAAASGASVTH